MEKKYTIYECSCGWYSQPKERAFSSQTEGDPFPWYCEECGKRVVNYCSGTLSELKNEYYILASPSSEGQT